MDKRYVAIAAVVGSVLILAYYIYNTSGDNHKSTETPLVGLNGQLEYAPFHPHNVVPGQQQIFSPHRYPNVSGGNLSCVIHNGFDSLRVPAQRDRIWIERPPGEEMW